MNVWKDFVYKVCFNVHPVDLMKLDIQSNMLLQQRCHSLLFKKPEIPQKISEQ